jgi:hypothetical protein
MVQTATVMKTLFTILPLLMCCLSFLSAQEPVTATDAPPAAGTPAEATDETPAAETPATPPAEPASVEKEAVIPAIYDISRYQSTWDKNPFLLKTVAVTQPTANWAQDYSLAGMFNNKGKIRISLRNKQTNEFKHISNDAKPDAEFRLVKANFNRNRNEASAVIAKGTEEAEIKYDDTAAAPQALTINNTMRPAGGAPGSPGAPGSVHAPGSPGSPGIQQGGAGGSRPGQPPLIKPGTTAAGGRVFNAPGLPGGVSAQPTNPQFTPGAAASVTVGGGNVISQPGIVQPGVSTTPGTTLPIVSRRRQLIPAPVIPAQP